MDLPHKGPITWTAFPCYDVIRWAHSSGCTLLTETDKSVVTLQGQQGCALVSGSYVTERRELSISLRAGSFKFPHFVATNLLDFLCKWIRREYSSVTNASYRIHTFILTPDKTSNSLLKCLYFSNLSFWLFFSELVDIFTNMVTTLQMIILSIEDPWNGMLFPVA